MLYSLMRLLHLLAVVGLAGGVIIENIAIKPSISGEDARNLARVDAVCGLSALLLLGFGLLLWLTLGKPAEFYSINPIFHAKLGLFVLLILCASYPALFFYRRRDSQETAIAVPVIIRVLLKIELILLLLIPILAYLMARGIGLPG
jgi:putative membrane protein